MNAGIEDFLEEQLAVLNGMDGGRAEAVSRLRHFLAELPVEGIQARTNLPVTMLAEVCREEPDKVHVVSELVAEDLATWAASADDRLAGPFGQMPYWESLFRWCVVYPDAERFGPPLQQALEAKRAVLETERESFVGPLKSALILNQHDTALESLWFELLENPMEESVRGLMPGWREDFRGILHLPMVDDELNWPAVARGVKAVFERFGKFPKREMQLKAQSPSGLMRSVYADIREIGLVETDQLLSQKLIQQSHVAEWTAEIENTLPNQLVGDIDSHLFTLPSIALMLIPRLSKEESFESCGLSCGRMVLFLASGDYAQLEDSEIEILKRVEVGRAKFNRPLDSQKMSSLGPTAITDGQEMNDDQLVENSKETLRNMSAPEPQKLHRDQLYQEIVGSASAESASLRQKKSEASSCRRKETMQPA